MSYDLNSDTQETYGPTISGLKALKDVYYASTFDAPALTHFLQYGYTGDVADLAKQCRQLAQTIADTDVKTTLEHIADVASKSKEFITLCG
jgi:hypothetical protein